MILRFYIKSPLELFSFYAQQNIKHQIGPRNQFLLSAVQLKMS